MRLSIVAFVLAAVTKGVWYCCSSSTNKRVTIHLVKYWISPAFTHQLNSFFLWSSLLYRIILWSYRSAMAFNMIMNKRQSIDLSHFIKRWLFPDGHLSWHTIAGKARRDCIASSMLGKNLHSSSAADSCFTNLEHSPKGWRCRLPSFPCPGQGTIHCIISKSRNLYYHQVKPLDSYALLHFHWRFMECISMELVRNHGQFILIHWVSVGAKSQKLFTFVFWVILVLAKRWFFSVCG